MRRIILIVMGLMLTMTAYTQSRTKRNLDKMPEHKRNEYLLKTAKEAVMKYGSGYYKEYHEPVIIMKTVIKYGPELTPQEQKENMGRIYYTVEYPGDSEQEYFTFGYAAKTYIWAHNGKVFTIMFGNGLGFGKLDKKAKTRGGDQVMKYTKQPPLEPYEIKIAP